MATERKKFFAGLERQVVRLSIAIAERILHRECTLDPTLLSGPVRVVLDQLEGDSKATIVIAAGEQALWQTAVSAMPAAIEIKEDASLRRGECVLQTETGSFEIGVRQQLCEVERGLFDLLERSPMAAG